MRFVIVLAVLALSACAPSEPVAPKGFVIKNASVFDGLGGTSLTAGVRVEGDTIVAIVDDGDEATEEGYDVIDATGLTLVPGFIDAHNHLSIAALHPRWHDLSAVTSLDELLEAVRAQAEAEGLDKVLKEAGFDWREAGCSMCLGMNPDQLKPKQRCASTSNRNFEGRQGRLGRTHLLSPIMAAAAAIEGHFVDIRTKGWDDGNA